MSLSKSARLPVNDKRKHLCLNGATRSLLLFKVKGMNVQNLEIFEILVNQFNIYTYNKEQMLNKLIRVFNYYEGNKEKLLTNFISLTTETINLGHQRYKRETMLQLLRILLDNSKQLIN